MSGGQSVRVDSGLSTPCTPHAAAENPILAAALSYAQQGWPVFPCRPGGKQPLVPKGFRAATRNPDTIREWWRRWPEANIGIPCGEAFTVLDIDGPDGEVALNALAREHGQPLPDTLEATTGRGRHLYFAACGLRNNAGKLAPHVDMRAAGGYVIVPPSIHQSGAEYKWVNGQPFTDWPMPLHELPEWVQALARSRTSPRSSDQGRGAAKVAQVGQLIPEGQRNDFLTRRAGKLRRNGLHSDKINAALQVINTKRCRPPLPEGEVSAIAASVSRYEPATLAQSESHSRYYVQGGRIYRRKAMHDGEVTESLCDFSARIVSEEIHDDGAERHTMFVIEGSLPDGTPLDAVRVRAAEFATMNWPLAHWGVRALVNAGQGAKDHLRAAIQTLSTDPKRRTVYGHLGWRRIDGEWLFLHARGAIGSAGTLDAVEVEPGDSRLRDYDLPAPPEGDQLRVAVQASLATLNLAPLSITVPLLAAVYRAPLSEALAADLTLYLAGESGTHKTALTAIAQAHFGARFDGRNLPANWHSTANALEHQAFRAKDVLLTVDDFAPSGTQTDVQKLHREAERLLRAQGNRAGRQRMSADGGMRPEYHPRGLIVSSGEDVPAGLSLRARLFILETRRGAVDLGKLTATQQDAANGLLAQAMAGYLQWLAPRMGSLRTELPGLHRKLREEARQAVTGHDRTPDAVASLALGLRFLLDFAEEAGAISADGALQRRDEGWKTLCAVARAQGGYHASEDPVRRFLALVFSVLESGAAHLADAANEGRPAGKSARWGWRLENPERNEWREQGRRIGWIDSADPEHPRLLLLPDAVFGAAQEEAHRQGTALPLTPRTLWRRLAERGLLTGEEGHNTGKASIAGRRVRVLRLSLQQALSLTSGASGAAGAEP